jgi:hypothetical protein
MEKTVDESGIDTPFFLGKIKIFLAAALVDVNCIENCMLYKPAFNAFILDDLDEGFIKKFINHFHSIDLIVFRNGSTVEWSRKLHLSNTHP